MGSRLGAFGIYSNGRPREIVARAWGAEGYLLARWAAAWKGRVYVHALADDGSAPLVAAIERLVERTIAAVPARQRRPRSSRAFPPRG